MTKNFLQLNKGRSKLSHGVVNALVQVILTEGKLYSKKDRNKGIIISLDNGETFSIPTNTVQSWVRRDTLIPNTNTSVRDALNQARKEHSALTKERKREERRENILKKAETNLHRVSKIRTSEVQYGKPIKDKEGNKLLKPLRIDDGTEHGGIYRKQNPRLIGHVVKASQFILERLNSEEWGRKEKVENKSLIISLSELRKFKMKYEEQ